jgi:DNA recombination protein RmuC
MASHNRAVGSLESRVLVSARKFKELGATTGADIPELTPIETAVRQLAATEGDSQ